MRPPFLALCCLAFLASGCNKSSSSPTTVQEQEKKIDKSGAILKSLGIKDVKVGTGETAEVGDILNVRYKGSLLNKVVFDENMSEGKPPFGFRLGVSAVIQGWQKGLVGMKVGGERQLAIPSDMGYADMGSGDKIPPYSDLYFDIKLIGIVKPNKSDTVAREILQTGSGKKVGATDLVDINFTGSYMDGQVFDKTTPGKPTTFPMDSPRVPLGLARAMLGQPVGTKLRVTLPPAVGFQSGTDNGAIPDNMITVFNLEIVATRPKPDSK
ncbi:MAG: FKBP-type peptidyl-prolyl cis-trans isomerase [Armatimonadetes bacterium]|nr:FKBP-type peptidyl-prolyl cis-trans isomerase [Armatimonadota bacterium]